MFKPKKNLKRERCVNDGFKSRFNHPPIGTQRQFKTLVRKPLNIIWRVSCSTIDYLRLNESLCKMSSIYFGRFWAFLVSSSTSPTAALECLKSDQTEYQWGFMIILLC